MPGYDPMRSAILEELDAEEQRRRSRAVDPNRWRRDTGFGPAPETPTAPAPPEAPSAPAPYGPPVPDPVRVTERTDYVPLEDRYVIDRPPADPTVTRSFVQPQNRWWEDTNQQNDRGSIRTPDQRVATTPPNYDANLPGGGPLNQQRADQASGGGTGGRTSAGDFARMEGYDANKWATEPTLKYEVGRILSRYPPTPQGLQQAMNDPDMKRVAPNAKLVGFDKIDFGGILSDITGGVPVYEVDVGLAFDPNGNTGRAWGWIDLMNDNGGSPAPSPANNGGGGPDQPAPGNDGSNRYNTALNLGAGNNDIVQQILAALQAQVGQTSDPIRQMILQMMG